MDNLITIVESDELAEIRLTDLVGRKGKIVQPHYILAHPLKLKGAWVELEGKPYMGEQEWYIPEKSIKQ